MKWKSKSKFSVVGVVAALLLSGCATEGEQTPVADGDATATEGEITTIRVVLPRARELAGEDAYLHVANELGYAEENGIRFEFESAIGSTDGTKLVTTDQAEVTVPSPFVSITARASGLGVTSVFTTLQENIFGFGVKPGSDITSIADLKGKKVALGDGGWTVIAAPVLASAGLSVEDVEWVVAGERRQLSVVEDEVDAVLTWEMEYQNWADQGVDVSFFGANDVDFQANGLVVADSFLADEPELVKAIVRSAAMGAAFVTANPEAAARIASGTFEGVTPKTDQGMVAVVEALSGLMNGGDANEMGYGIHDVASWDGLVEALYQNGVIDEPFPASDLVTNEFIEYANGFDLARVQNDARDF